jgi:hypothetical protein
MSLFFDSYDVFNSREKHMKVWVLEKKLSDGSPVYDVAIGDERIPCESQKQAELLADRLREAIDGNSIATHGENPDWKWWCKSCGTLTNDGECDCTKFNEPGDSQVLIRNP